MLVKIIPETSFILAQPIPWKSEYVAELLFYCGRELLTNVLIAFAVSENTKRCSLNNVE